MKRLVGLCLLLCSLTSAAQVDTSYVYNPTAPFGSLDIRLRKSNTRYYYLQENITFSFRQNASGAKTNTFKDMTSWDSSPYAQGNLREKNGSNDYFVMNYRLLFPINYNASYSQGYPLIVMLHGAGERGNCWDASCFWSDRNYKPTDNNPPAPTGVNHELLNNDMNLVHGGLPHLTARNLANGKLPSDPTLHPRAWPGFVLFPQNLNGWETTPAQDAIRLIRLVIKKYNIDPNRIYVHGLSNGGGGVYEVIKRAPWLFAAALPMSAVSDGSINSKGVVPSVATIPIWTFQGGQDTAPTPAKTEGYVKKFREGGMDVRYTLYKNLGHGTWNTAYDEPDFFTWMLGKNKSNIHVFYNRPSVCATTMQGAKLGLAPGFYAYQWEKDGVIIPGATANEYIATEAGIYRARFSRKENPVSEGDWNKWSDPVTVTLTEPVKAKINVYGTHLMRGPDSDAFYNTVHLQSDGINDKYYWYKNGVLINIPGTSLDDTTRHYSVYAGSASGNGKFTLVTQSIDNCPSPPSDTLYLFFGNSAATMDNANSPTNFTGVAISNNTVDVTWTDNSSIETGYEIWRRKPGDIFRLAGKVPANVTYFRDTNLEPSVAYDYKVRAVNETMRSNYAPSNSKTVNLVITTHVDNTPPTAPSGLTVTDNTTSTIKLSWSPSTDDTGIRQYHITYGTSVLATGSNATTATITGLPMNVAYNFYIHAEDLGGNLSPVVGPVYGSTYVTGLSYGHSTGAWNDLDEITNWATPEFTGKVPNFTLAPRTQEDYFNFEFTGYLYINQAGNYQFRTTSDDGSRLTLNNLVIVDNDGLHGDVTKESVNQYLPSGPHLINVKYFENTGGQTLTVQYRGPDTFGWTTIPNSALRSGSAPPVAAASAPMSMRVASTSVSEETVTVHVFPNPTSANNIHVQVEAIQSGSVDINLTDLMGRSYFKKTFSSEEVANGVQVVPSAGIQNGLYVLVVRYGTETSQHRIIIKD